MFVFSPYFFHTMGIHSSHALEIAWISALHEIFKKPLPYLPWFAIFFSTHWVCTFSILEKMNSNSKEKNIGKTKFFAALQEYNPYEEYVEECLQSRKN